MFGADVMPWLPRWETRFEAVRVLRQHGDVDEILQRLGVPPQHVRFVRTGDLITLLDAKERVGRTALMVCVDAGRCLYACRDGVAIARLRDLTPADMPLAYSLWAIDG